MELDDFNNGANKFMKNGSYYKELVTIFNNKTILKDCTFFYDVKDNRICFEFNLDNIVENIDNIKNDAIELKKYIYKNTKLLNANNVHNETELGNYNIIIDKSLEYNLDDIYIYSDNELDRFNIVVYEKENFIQVWIYYVKKSEIDKITNALNLNEKIVRNYRVSIPINFFMRINISGKIEISIIFYYLAIIGGLLTITGMLLNITGYNIGETIMLFGIYIISFLVGVVIIQIIVVLNQIRKIMK